jgi:hypothetical protein
MHEEPVFADIHATILWNVRQLRKEVAELRAELRGDQRDRAALTAHWNG